jgi:hypothetical protein
MNKIAIVIGNNGLGDLITCIGMVNYLSTKYDIVYVACNTKNEKSLKYFYKNNNVYLYPINKNINTTFYEFTELMRKYTNYDVFAYGNYGAMKIDINDLVYTKTMHDGKTRRIISYYPTSYYDDCNIPIEYMKKYFSVIYPREIDELYNELLSNPDFSNYIVVHQDSSNMDLNITRASCIDINNILVIDVNNNLYNNNHKYHNIAQKFINLSSVIYYKKLLENAREIHVIDSCIHALALVIDLPETQKRVCYMREIRFSYAFNKFQYYQIVLSGKMDAEKMKITSN